MARNFASASSQYLSYAGAVVSGPPFTVSAWVYQPSFTAGVVVFWIGVSSTANQYYLVSSGGTGIPRFSARNTTARNADAGAAMSTNTWAHVCAVATDTTNRAVFLNGGNKGTSAVAVTNPTLDKTAIGRQDGSTPAGYWNGRIGEVAVWSTNLSDAEVAALGKGASPLRIRRGSLVAYWPLFGLASPEPEYVGSGKGMTVSGATLADHAPVRSSFAIPSVWGWQGIQKPAGGATNYQTLAVAMTLTPLITLQVNKPMAISPTLTPLIQRQIAKTLPVSATLTSAMQKQVSKTLAVTSTLTAVLATIKTKVVTMAVNVTLTPAVQRQINKTLAVSATFTSAIQRQTAKTLAVTATLTGAIQKQIPKTLAVSVTLTPGLAKQVVKLVTLAVSVVLTPAIRRQISKNIVVTVTLAANIQKQIGKMLSSAVSMALGFATQILSGGPPQTPGQGVPVRASERSNLIAQARDTLRSRGRGNLISAARETLRSRGRSGIEPGKKE